MRFLVWRAAPSVALAAVLAASPLSGLAQELDKLMESARAAQSGGDYAAAAKFYGRATVLAPASAELWANRGIMEYLADEFLPAEASLKHSLQLNPRLFSSLLFLGKTLIQTDRPAQALACLARARSQRPNDLEVAMSLGKANSALNRPRQAAAFYAQAARSSPASADAWLGLGGATLDVIAGDGRALAASAPHAAFARALYADELLTQGRPLEAVDVYKAAMENASASENATLSANLEWMESHSESFPLPQNSQEALRRLNAEANTGRESAASIPCSVAGRSPAPDSAAEAACAYWAGDYGRSVDLSSQALKLSPRSAEMLYWSVKANERIAVDALSRFESIAPKSPTTYDLVGDLYRNQRNPDSALEEYKKALAIDGHDPGALLGTAAADLSANKLDDAAAVDRIALVDRPLDPQLNLLMAEVLAAEDHYDRIEAYLAKCRNAPPEMQARIHLLRGRAESENGNIKEAIQQFELAAPGDRDGSAHYQLSRLYRKVGRVADAQRCEAEARAIIHRRDANAAIALREAAGTFQ